MSSTTPEGHNTLGIPGSLYLRQKQSAERSANRALNKALPIRITGMSTHGSYSGHELSLPAVRAGADDHMKLPSRYMDELRYRDGRRVAV